MNTLIYDSAITKHVTFALKPIEILYMCIFYMNESHTAEDPLSAILFIVSLKHLCSIYRD